MTDRETVRAIVDRACWNHKGAPDSDLQTEIIGHATDAILSAIDRPAVGPSVVDRPEPEDDYPWSETNPPHVCERFLHLPPVMAEAFSYAMHASHWGFAESLPPLGDGWDALLSAVRQETDHWTYAERARLYEGDDDETAAVGKRFAPASYWMLGAPFDEAHPLYAWASPDSAEHSPAPPPIRDPEAVYQAMKHGDDIHRDWLREACHALASNLPVPEARAATPIGRPAVEPSEDWREALAAAYIAGAQAVHENYQPDRDPDFAEAAHAYAIDRPAPAPVVEVKPLAERTGEGDTFERWERGHFRYKVLFKGGLFKVKLDGEGLVAESELRADAQALMEADYERRTLSALKVTTRDEVERETIEALAILFERGTLTEENSIQGDVPGVIRAQDSASLALLRSHKGSAS